MKCNLYFGAIINFHEPAEKNIRKEISNGRLEAVWKYFFFQFFMYSGLASHTFTSMLHFFIVLSQFKDSSIKELLGRILGPFQEKIHSSYLQGFGNFFKNFSGLREIFFVIFFLISQEQPL